MRHFLEQVAESRGSPRLRQNGALCLCSHPCVCDCGCRLLWAFEAAELAEAVQAIFALIKCSRKQRSNGRVECCRPRALQLLCCLWLQLNGRGSLRQEKQGGVHIDLAVAHPGDIFSLAMVALRGNSVSRNPFSDDGRRDVFPLPSLRVLGYHPAQVCRSVRQRALKKREKTIYLSIGPLTL